MPSVNNGAVHRPSNSYIQAFKTGHLSHKDEGLSQPSLVLDESCLHNFDYSLSLVGKLKEFGSLPNLKNILEEEGFLDIHIRYMGGFWVLFQFLSKSTLYNFFSHVGVNSRFSLIQHASDSFCIDERVAWIDVEGVPLKTWSRNTFEKISSKWGSLLYEEDEDSPHLHRKRLCIKTTYNDNIFDSFKIVVKGKIFWIRVKEVSGWAFDFSYSYDDSSESDNEFVDDKSIDGFFEKASEVEEIPKTVFESVEPGDIKDSVTKERKQDEVGYIHSEDPFNIYDILDKKQQLNHKISIQSEGDPKFPPGFTPYNSDGLCNQNHVSFAQDHDSKNVIKEDGCSSVNSGSFKHVNTPKTGGSMLQLIEDLIKVGQTMGYKMEGCINDIEEIVKKQGELEPYK
ncbi:hypothetical protein Tco_0454057 [Tanacetum coccineum]